MGLIRDVERNEQMELVTELLSVARRRYWQVPPWARRRIASDRHRRDRCRGFTLVEVVLIVGILFTLFGIALPAYTEAVEAAKVTRAIADVRSMANELMAFRIINGAVPDTLDEVGFGAHRDPWGNPYQYLKFTGKGKGQARKDKFLVPINSLYDLYSMGKDEETVAPLTAKKSWDDIIMANDGGYVGLAKEY